MALFLITSLFSLSLKANTVDVFEMKKKLDLQNKRIFELNKEMHGLELNLGIQNKKYQSISEARSKIEESLENAKKNIDLDNAQLKSSYNETKAILSNLILNKLEKTEKSSDLLARKILASELQNRMIELSHLMKENKGQEENLNGLTSRLESTIKTEKELTTLMNELEEKRKNLRSEIETEITNQKEETDRFNQLKNKTAMENEAIKKSKKQKELENVQLTEEISFTNRNADLFRSPVAISNGLEYNQKGVSFKFTGKNEVLATKDGKVVYVGALANYGNVVMIDHGNETRTVLLGQFNPTIKNLELVKSGQKIGVTQSDATSGLGGGKIYFEVRKNNLAQNTYLLLDKKTISKTVAR